MCTHTHSQCWTICDLPNHVNKQKLQNQASGDYSIKRQNSWGRWKQRTELGTKFQQNLIWPLSSPEGWSLGEKAKCAGVVDAFALPSLPSSQFLPLSVPPFSLFLFPPLLLFLLLAFFKSFPSLPLLFTSVS